MKRIAFLLSVLAVAVHSAFAWDFLYIENGARRATRNSDPFAVLDRVARTESLPVQWERAADGEGFNFFVDWQDARWYCTDGTMSVPASALPRTISKLDLLLVLQQLDKTAEFMAWVEQSGLRPYWDAAQIMSTDHPLYDQALAGVQAALGLTDAERDAILAQLARPYDEDRPASPSGGYPALCTADGTTVFMSYSSGKVWKSTDGGASWTQLSSSPSGGSPALCTADGTTVFMSYYNGKVWKSTDGGASWTQLSSSPSGDRPALCTADGTTVFMSYNSGKVWKSTDGGASWTQLSSSPSGNYPALCTADGTTVFMSYSSGKVWKSTDGGASWTQLSSSPSGNNPALCTADGTTVFMSYNYGLVWKSTDGGASWTELSSSPSGSWPALCTADGTTVFMSYVNGKVWKSTDGGASWTQLSSSPSGDRPALCTADELFPFIHRPTTTPNRSIA